MFDVTIGVVIGARPVRRGGVSQPSRRDKAAGWIVDGSLRREVHLAPSARTWEYWSAALSPGLYIRGIMGLFQLRMTFLIRNPSQREEGIKRTIFDSKVMRLEAPTL